jgi:hypothetical protein
MTQHSAAQHYVGSKIIKAWPATRTITNESHSEGSVEPGYAIEYADGYTSWSPKAVFEAAYLPLGNIEGMADYQQRVIAEKAENDAKLGRLATALNGNIRDKVGADEFNRMCKQESIMRELSAVLGDRIAAFRREA